MRVEWHADVHLQLQRGALGDDGSSRTDIRSLLPRATICAGTSLSVLSCCMSCHTKKSRCNCRVQFPIDKRTWENQLRAHAPAAWSSLVLNSMIQLKMAIHIRARRVDGAAAGEVCMLLVSVARKNDNITSIAEARSMIWNTIRRILCNHLKLRCFVSFICIRLLFASFLSFLFIFFLFLFCRSIDHQYA